MDEHPTELVEELRGKAATLYDSCRDEGRPVAEARMQLALSEAYINGYTAAVDFSRKEFERQVADFKERIEWFDKPATG